jgi:hypothetical protein
MPGGFDPGGITRWELDFTELYSMDRDIFHGNSDISFYLLLSAKLAVLRAYLYTV